MTNLKQRISKMTGLLEARYGVPRRRRTGSPLDSMVLTILSQSTSDKNRDLAYASLKECFPSWKQVAEADPKDVAEAIRRGGLSNQKSVVIRDFLLWTKQRFGKYTIDPICRMGEQEAYDMFCEVPGIGVKTVAVVLLFACRRNVFPVDTHVNRVCGRVGIVRPKSPPHKTHWLLQPHIPPGKALSLHLNLIRLGREICKARPNCPLCPLSRNFCSFRKSEVRS